MHKQGDKMHPIRKIKDFINGIKQGWRVTSSPHNVCGRLYCFKCEKEMPVYRHDNKILCVICNEIVPRAKYQGHIDIDPK